MGQPLSNRAQPYDHCPTRGAIDQPLEQRAGLFDLGGTPSPLLGIEPYSDVAIERGLDVGRWQHVGFPAAIAILLDVFRGTAVAGLDLDALAQARR